MSEPAWLEAGLTLFRVLNVAAALALMLSSARAAHRLRSNLWLSLPCVFIAVATSTAVFVYGIRAFTDIELGVWGAVLFSPAFAVMLGCSALIIERLSLVVAGRLSNKKDGQ